MDVIIYGTGSMAEYAAYVISNDSAYNVVGLCFENAAENQREVNGYPFYNFCNLDEIFPPENYQLFIAVGINKERQRIFDLAKSKGYTMISYISSKANTWPDLIHGENTLISEGSTISAFAKLGHNSFLLGANLGHHVTIGNHCLLSGPSMGGRVHIGDFSFLGINSSIQQNVKIGSNNIIGMGSIIHKDTGDDEIHHVSRSTKVMKIKATSFEKIYLK